MPHTRQLSFAVSACQMICTTRLYPTTFLSKRKLDQRNMIIFALQKNYAIGFGEVPLHQINSFLD
jgi:hypothetical protein